MSTHVTILDPAHAAFPAVLRSSPLLTPVSRLWAVGNLDLLATPLHGLFCSTRCSGQAILRIYDWAVAQRQAGTAIISGFHTPMEKECLDILLRGTQPVIICPARSIERLRLPTAWRQPLAQQRLLMLSPFAPPQRRPTAAVAEQRNHVVATLAADIFMAYAAPGSRTAQLGLRLLAEGKPLSTLNLPDNVHLLQHGARAIDA